MIFQRLRENSPYFFWVFLEHTEHLLIFSCKEAGMITGNVNSRSGNATVTKDLSGLLLKGFFRNAIESFKAISSSSYSCKKTVPLCIEHPSLYIQSDMPDGRTRQLYQENPLALHKSEDKLFHLGGL